MELLIALGVSVAVLAVVGLYVMSAYNKLVKYRERGDTQFSQIDLRH